MRRADGEVSIQSWGDLPHPVGHTLNDVIAERAQSAGVGGFVLGPENPNRNCRAIDEAGYAISGPVKISVDRHIRIQHLDDETGIASLLIALPVRVVAGCDVLSGTQASADFDHQSIGELFIANVKAMFAAAVQLVLVKKASRLNVRRVRKARAILHVLPECERLSAFDVSERFELGSTENQSLGQVAFEPHEVLPTRSLHDDERCQVVDSVLLRPRCAFSRTL